MKIKLFFFFSKFEEMIYILFLVILIDKISSLQNCSLGTMRIYSSVSRNVPDQIILPLANNSNVSFLVQTRSFNTFINLCYSK